MPTALIVSGRIKIFSVHCMWTPQTFYYPFFAPKNAIELCFMIPHGLTFLLSRGSHFYDNQEHHYQLDVTLTLISLHVKSNLITWSILAMNFLIRISACTWAYVFTRVFL